jgi:hypothetical protein
MINPNLHTWEIFVAKFVLNEKDAIWNIQNVKKLIKATSEIYGGENNTDFLLL